jgi:hypothetical protein
VSDTDPKDETNAEIELHTELERELTQLLHHPHEEAQRLHALAEEGESAATPFIEIGVVARWVIPFAILMIGLVFAVYYAARHWA